MSSSNRIYAKSWTSCVDNAQSDDKHGNLNSKRNNTVSQSLSRLFLWNSDTGTKKKKTNLAPYSFQDETTGDKEAESVISSNTFDSSSYSSKGLTENDEYYDDELSVLTPMSRVLTPISPQHQKLSRRASFSVYQTTLLPPLHHIGVESYVERRSSLSCAPSQRTTLLPPLHHIGGESHVERRSSLSCAPSQRMFNCRREESQRILQRRRESMSNCSALAELAEIESSHNVQQDRGNDKMWESTGDLSVDFSDLESLLVQDEEQDIRLMS